jgi:predicted nucleic acid-binding protein
VLFLVDTSVWVDHIDRLDPQLQDLLTVRSVLGHPFVLGETLLGNIKDRREFSFDYGLLPSAELANDHEVLKLIEDHKLFGTGLGYIDAHLLASAFLTSCKLMTKDKRLAAAATKLGVGG